MQLFPNNTADQLPPLKRIFAEQILIPVVRLLPGDSTYWGQMHSFVLDVILEK